jgi:hypothetical protein
LKYWLITILAWTMLSGEVSFAQSNPPISFGVELDVLPYATGGYFGALWLGKNHLRFRALTAKVFKPDWSTKEGFKNHEIQAYALVIDYFPALNWRKWWIGAGPVIWKSKIQADGSSVNTSFSNFLLNGSIGYHLGLGRHFYLSPWAGLSLKIAGDKDVSVQNKIYNLPLLNPEMSLKFGFHF